MLDRKGNDKQKAYIATFTKKQFFLLEPRIEDVDIVDIAHALSLQCRWTGHCQYHYSIAQHSYYCSFLGPQNEAFDRLMHDAAEAYIGDLNRPLKHYTEAGVAYRRQETIVQDVIAERFGFSKIEPPSVKIADNSMMYAEKKQIMGYAFEEPQEEIHQYDVENGIVIESWTSKYAETMFLERFKELFKGRIN